MPSYVVFVRFFIAFVILYFSGATHALSQDVIIKYGLNHSAYLKGYKKYTAKRYSLIHIDAYVVNKKIYFSTLWSRVSDRDSKAIVNLSRSSLEEKSRNFKAQGYQIISLKAYSLNGQNFYAALWAKQATPTATVLSVSQEDFKTRLNKLRQDNYILKSIAVQEEQGKLHVTALLHQGKGIRQDVKIGLSKEEYRKQQEVFKEKGYQLFYLNIVQTKGKNFYSAIWRAKPDSHSIVEHQLTSVNLKSALSNRYYAGYKLQSVVGYAIGKRAYFTASWKEGTLAKSSLSKVNEMMHQFLQKYSVPGLSIAIARKGKLVFAQGYGMSRLTPEWRASPLHRYRIGNISMPITSLAILKLVEQGRLKLDDRVFGEDAILGAVLDEKTPKEQSRREIYSEEIKKITVQHLLHHTAGGRAWSSSADMATLAKPDPVLLQPELNNHKLISWVLKNKTDQVNPGEAFIYSNFGYHILGRIIEKASGMAYDKYVRKYVLRPAGIRRMLLASSLRAKRKQGEAVYYGTNGENPYIFDMNRMRAYGGWLASPIDLVRLMVHVDGQKTKKDIVSADMIKTMTTGSTANSKYALGWNVNGKGKWWHVGSMPGSYGILVRKDNEYCWALLTNARSEHAEFKKEFNELAIKIIAMIKNWPENDLFEG